ncbi:MAG: hypothetical protein JNL13_11845 [Chitinophagaceae bacterium]|nr:hypothetical protein [Chitinophagaceae bacterium]
MRRSQFWLPAILLALLLLLGNTPGSRAQGGYTASYQDFYDDLSPYGQWIQDPQYGYVWLPDVPADFRPYYTNGYWTNTQYGNTWVSGYDWGWAPFHYGRWTYDNYYGWLWIPDTEWAPAWVSWRSSNDYYGWAPMGPGINININLGRIPVDWWVFINPGYFYDRSFYRYCNNDYGFRRGIYSRTNIINYTYIDNRTTYYTGPRADDYYQHTGRRPSMYHIDNNNRRGAARVKGDRISIYRPDVRNTANATPSRVANTDRAVSRRPQAFTGTSETARGREQVLRGSTTNNVSSPGRTQRMNESATPAVQQRATSREQGTMQQQQQRMQEQRATQVDQQRAQAQQRNMQQQQRMQEQQAAQMEQQRAQAQHRRMQQQRMQEQQAAQMDQQRAQAQQRSMQQQRMQEQQAAQMEQQRTQAQQRSMQQQRMQEQQAAQMEQQRAQAQQRDMQQQRMQEQRAQQMEQQRAQAQQRDMQQQQQRMQEQRAQQMEQQRAQQAQQQQRMQEQRAQQMEQQRAQQAQQRDMQRTRMENSSPVQRQQESPMRMHRDGAR